MKKWSLTIVTWNCAMALRKKHPQLIGLNGDVLVIQECAKKDIADLTDIFGWSTAWFGENKNKGLGVIARGPWTVQQSEALDINLAGKVQIAGPTPMQLFAIWACKGKGEEGNYIRQVHKLLDLIEDIPFPSHTAILGDFNSNSIWDHEHGLKSHSVAVSRLHAIGFKSAYHTFTNEAQGKETQSSIYFLKNKAKKYHIDYIFLSKELHSQIKRVSVGTYEEWIGFSDHVPILVELGAQ